jgi:flavin-dependent dehydrogenase
MSAPRPITIVGGGLAGLTLGIGLRQKGIRVTVWEAGHYPRHRVCGEFISGHGQESLKRLGLWEPIIRSGGIPARTAAFFSNDMHSPVQRLPQPALSISRLILDALLADQFKALGGELREEQRWTEKGANEGVVRASGRRAKAAENGCRWFGLKVHAQNVALVADLEMHLLADGYVGISRLADGNFNLCGLFRRRKDEPANAKSWREILCGPSEGGLAQRLKNALLDESSFRSVAGLNLQPQRARGLAECCVGDALTMIAPVTGNGMSMAFESADLAIEPLAAYSRGELPWKMAQQTIARACDKQFATRLTWSGWLQRLMFTRGLHHSLGQFILGSRWLWGAMFSHTR